MLFKVVGKWLVTLIFVCAALATIYMCYQQNKGTNETPSHNIKTTSISPPSDEPPVAARDNASNTKDEEKPAGTEVNIGGINNSGNFFVNITSHID